MKFSCLHRTGVTVLGGIDSGDLWNVASIANKTGGFALNFWVPGGGTALANVVDSKLVEGKAKYDPGKPAASVSSKTSAITATPPGAAATPGQGQTPPPALPAKPLVDGSPSKKTESSPWVKRAAIGGGLLAAAGIAFAVLRH